MDLKERILTGLVFALLALFIYFIFKTKIDEEEEDDNRFLIPNLCVELKRIINEIVNMDLSGTRLNKKDLQNRKKLKKELSKAVRRCYQGDLKAKTIVFAKDKKELANTLHISPEVIDCTLPFHSPELLTPQDKYEIMMYLEKRDGNYNMFRGICEKTGIDKLKKDDNGYYYSISERDIEEAYDKLSQTLSYDDKLNILTQRIYQEIHGLSVVDLLIMEDDSIDGILGGASGSTRDDFRYEEDSIYTGNYRQTGTHNSVWIIYKGKPIHLKFLSFQTKENLTRTCKNLAEHGKKGHVTSEEGGVKTHLADGSRVTIFRPNNSTQWVFFIRKFKSVVSYELKDLLTDIGYEAPVNVIEWAVRGCLNILFSGDQDSGKTTLTRAAIGKMDRRHTVRSIEADFELYAGDAYQYLNYVGIRPSKKMNFTNIIELLKASNAHTILFGETASLEHAKHLIDLLLAGTKRIVTTGHWPSPDEMIAYFVHSMGAFGNSGGEAVEALVSRLIHLDIHCVKDNDGHRHIERITEIIPLSMNNDEPETEAGVEGSLTKIAYHLGRMARKKTYFVRDILVYEKGKYKMVHPFSPRLAAIIMSNLPPEEGENFVKFNSLPMGGEQKLANQ